MTDADLRETISETLNCRIDQQYFPLLFSFFLWPFQEKMVNSFLGDLIHSRENCDDKMEKFLMRCFYQTGQYDSVEDFRKLDTELKAHEVML